MKKLINVYDEILKSMGELSFYDSSNKSINYYNYIVNQMSIELNNNINDYSITEIEEWGSEEYISLCINNIQFLIELDLSKTGYKQISCMSIHNPLETDFKELKISNEVKEIIYKAIALKN